MRSEIVNAEFRWLSFFFYFRFLFYFFRVNFNAKQNKKTDAEKIYRRTTLKLNHDRKLVISDGHQGTSACESITCKWRNIQYM